MQRRGKALEDKKLMYMGMGVSGGEEGARHGPSLMPGGPRAAYDMMEPILLKIAAQVDGDACVTYLGPGGSGNYVKMVHNGIEYGDMELIAESYDLLKTVGGYSNAELAEIFAEWNKGELESFLIEITAAIFTKKDDKSDGDLVDAILDRTGAKGTGKMTVQEAAEQLVAAPTIAAALDGRYMSSIKDDREAASKILRGPEDADKVIAGVDRKQLLSDVRDALYAAKICSYAQGMNLLRSASEKKEWDLQLGSIARIWKGGCIIRAKFLDRITAAYTRNGQLASLLVDDDFAKELIDRQAAWRRIVGLSVQSGIACAAFSASLAYYDTNRRARLPHNLIQAQRDLFGAHTYMRNDGSGPFHTQWIEKEQ